MKTETNNRAGARKMEEPHPAVPPKKVLAFVDFSDISIRAAQTAGEMATRWGKPLELVHATGAGAAAQGRQAPAGALEARLREAVYCRRLTKTSVIAGDPRDVIGGVAAGQDDSMLVMGAASRATPGDALGSVAEAVFNVARVPVLTLRSVERRPWPGRILVPLTASERFDGLLLYAVSLARSFKGSVGVVHIAEGSGYRKTASEAFSARLRRLKLERERRLDELIACSGPAVDCVLEKALSRDVGLVALEAFRERALGRPILGPAAQSLLRRCAAPTITVPSGDLRSLEELL